MLYILYNFQEYAIDVDRLYEYLYTDCDFYRSIRSARKHFGKYNWKIHDIYKPQ